MAKKTKEAKALDARIARLYGETCSGIQIDIMDIGKVYKVAREAPAGISDVRLAVIIREFVETIRKN